MCADGFALQKGAIFGFGPTALDPTQNNILKISNVDDKTLSELDRNVQVHNIGEERNVGMVNYEFSVRGKSSLDAVSRKVVINRSSDLINEQAHGYRKFRKASQSIDEIKAAWNKKTEGNN